MQSPTAIDWQAAKGWITQLVASEIGDAIADEFAGKQVTGDELQRRADACATYIVARLSAPPAPEPWQNEVTTCPRCLRPYRGL